MDLTVLAAAAVGRSGKVADSTRGAEPLADGDGRESRREAVEVPAAIAGIAEHHLIFPVRPAAPVTRPLLWHRHKGGQFSRICRDRGLATGAAAATTAVPG